MGRCGLQWATRRASSARTLRQELYPNESPPASASERGRAVQEPDEIEGPRESRTCVLGAQADLRVFQSAVSRFGKEYQLALGHLWLGESLSRSATPPGQPLRASARQGSWSRSVCSGSVLPGINGGTLGETGSNVAGSSKQELIRAFLDV